MSYSRLLGWGIVIYAVMELTWVLLVVYGIIGTATAPIFELMVLIVVATIAGRSLRLSTWSDILPYSLGWVCIAALLDAAIHVPFEGTKVFMDWNLWVEYALIIIVPLLAPYTRPLPEMREL